MKEQSVVAILIVKAEYITLANTTKEAIWLWSLLAELNFSQTSATLIHCDSQATPFLHSWAKHIDIWYYFIQEHIVKHEVKLHYTSTKEMFGWHLYQSFTTWNLHQVSWTARCLSWHFIKWECWRMISNILTYSSLKK